MNFFKNHFTIEMPNDVQSLRIAITACIQDFSYCWRAGKKIVLKSAILHVLDSLCPLCLRVPYFQ